jgi:NitT/TauT family transport system ATP-binding protein
VLDGVSLTLREGEIVALLGRSGSGKSTMLRCIAGLIAPSAGSVSYRGELLNGANPGVAMVFQSFALLPWLTVQQNVELAMQARDVPSTVRHERALRVIDLIGLDGFESAYPKELSGGMRQRVGFARALAVQPDALLMDEPFSALDVLTAANLRGELTRLWENREFPTKAVLIVTHNIEEAVQLADRILVLSSNPGRIRAELPVTLPRPRDRHEPGFEQLVDTVYGILTGREEAAAAAVVSSAPGPGLTPSEVPLPEVSAGGLSGLLEILAARGGREGLAGLAGNLSFEVDDLLPLVDAADLLGLATVEQRGAGDHQAGSRVRHRGHRQQQDAVRQAGLRAGSADQGDRERAARHRRRDAARGVLPGPAAPRVPRRRGPPAARHRHRLGPVRRAVRVRLRKRAAGAGVGSG